MMRRAARGQISGRAHRSRAGSPPDVSPPASNPSARRAGSPGRSLHRRDRRSGPSAADRRSRPDSGAEIRGSPATRAGARTTTASTPASGPAARLARGRPRRVRPRRHRAASAARVMNTSPSCVRLMRRVVRCSSRAPSSRSSCASRALATAADKPNSRPAADTFASSAARTNSATSSRSSRSRSLDEGRAATDRWSANVILLISRKCFSHYDCFKE